MSAEYFYGVRRMAAAKRTGRPSRPIDPRGQPATGRVARLLVGQGHGYIRLHDKREVYFHRGDVPQGTSFNDFRVGDVVTFELLEDAVSGARALRVMRKKQT